MDELALKSLAELSRLIDARQISPVELTRSYIERIARLDGHLHAWNCLRADAAIADAQASERRAMAGARLGPLDGIAIGIKDLIDVEGLPTTAQAEHRRNHVAAGDAAAVAALKRAGAIILGKQATAEYAVGGTRIDGPWPATRNPWDLERDPSSSSSGSAVAVAAGLCAGSVGTETAGSIRDPAAWCGVAGLKPTNGLVSTQGVLTLSQSMDCVGPLAWTTEDCRLMLAAMVPAGQVVRRSNADLEGGGLRGVRIGVVRDFYEDDPDMDDDVIAAMERSLLAFETLGARLSTVKIGDFDDYGATARAISWPEEYENHRDELEAFSERLSTVSRSRLQDGRRYSAADYIRAKKRLTSAQARLHEIMRYVDVLVLPTNKKPAQVLGYEHMNLGHGELSLTRPFNLTGGPALASCNGFTRQGLPTSIQIIGRHLEDYTVLSTGVTLEHALALRDRRPPNPK